MSMQGTTRRRLLLGTMGAVFGVASCNRALGAATASEERPVSGFDAVLWDAAGELIVEQTGRERLVIDAEPAVLRKIVTRVRDRQLEIGFAPGRVETTEPIRFRLQVSALRKLELRGTGEARIGALQTPVLSLALVGGGNLSLERLVARTLEFRLAGSGDLRIGGGQVESQRIVVEGAGEVETARMSSRQAEVSIGGSGNVHVAAHERLTARISGSGDVLYHGRPQVQQDVTGAGSVQRSGS